MNKRELNDFLSNFEPDSPCQFEVWQLCDSSEHEYLHILKTKPRDEWPLFHNFVILHHVEVSDAPTRKRIVESLIHDINEEDVFIAMCFEPHHGIRIVQNGQRVDLLICYMCGRFDIFRDDETPRPPMGSSGSIGSQYQWVLNELFD